MKHQRLWVACILAVAATIFALISFGNHLNFRTYCLDLGQYTNVLYDYAHGRIDDCSAFLWEPQNTLGDHFDLYLLLFSPLVFLFGQYTLLIIQIVALTFGALGMYLLIKEYTSSLTLPLLAMVSYLGCFGIWQALGFDYHSSVVAINLFPWLLRSFKRGRYGWSTLWVVLFLLAKETMPLFIFFLALALMWDYRKNRRALCWLGGYMALAVGYFVVIGMVVMPSLGSNSQVICRYNYMGDSFGAIALYILTHPWDMLVHFFTNFIGNPGDNGLKLEFWLCVACSGGLLLLVKKPHWLLMLVPCVAMKMLASDIAFWGIAYHYNADIMPVLVAGSFIALSTMERERWRQIAATALCLCTLLTTNYTFNRPKSWIRKDNLRIHSASHYQQEDFNADYARQLLAQIPDDASVCATTMFVPHLATRDSIYQFPQGTAYNPEYYLLLKHNSCSFEGEEEMVTRILSDTLRYETLATDGHLYLLRDRRSAIDDNQFGTPERDLAERLQKCYVPFFVAHSKSDIKH